MAEKSAGGDGGEHQSAVGGDLGSSRRMERRKAAKKEKRRQKRKEVAAKEREEEEARLNDPEEQQRVQLEEERERERVERERKAFEEHERMFLEALAAKRKAEEEDERRKEILEDELKQNQVGHKDENSDDDWEYTEEGPPEIIWQGNEIIVKKKKVRVKRKDTVQIKEEDPNRPTSNPLPPQSEAFADHRNRFVPCAQQLLDNVAQQTPNFGTEQDKAHCPFHLKTGACRFGSHCSRVHFYPDKSCTLLIKNMYTGPGISWEQDEGLEYTDEEVERSFEEFYEDVHTEFLKFGEIINFKVCKNGSSHLRGNVYIHYQSLDSALMAYQSVNGRYFAGKQVTCEFIGVTKWKLAICGEYMKSRHKTCNRGTACNFIHCFRNPGGDYEWADKDGPPPDYWVKKMAALFGHSEEYGYDNRAERKGRRNSSKMRTEDPDSSYRRSRSRDSSRSRYEEYESCSIRHFDRHHSGSRRAIEVPDKKNHGKMNTKSSRESKDKRTRDSDSEGDGPFMDGGEDRHQSNRRKNTRNCIEVLETQDFHADRDGRDQHRISTRDSSKHHNKVLSPDESKEKRGTNHGNDCREEDKSRYHRQMRKRSRHSSEARKLKDEASREESGFDKVEPLEVKKRHRSSREDHSSMEPSENNASGEGLKSDGYYETIISGHGERTKLCDVADMNVVGYQKSRERCSLRHQTSSRDSSSDESSYKTRSRMYSPRSKSHDSAYHSTEDLDKQSCWESDKSGLEKHCESERTSNGEFDRYTGNSNFKDPDSECCRGRRPRGSGWSSGQKSSDGLEEVDSAEECGEHKDKPEKHRRKHRTRICKQRHKKTN